MKFTVKDIKYGGIQQKVLLTVTKQFIDNTTLRVIAYYTAHGYFEIYLANTKLEEKWTASRVYVKNGVNELEVMNEMLDIVNNQPHLLEVGEFWR